MIPEQEISGLGDPALPDGAKPIWQSRTIIGAFVTILALAAGFKNFKIDVANLTDILVQVAGLIGAALAIYGRIRATQPIKFMGATQPGGAFNPKAEVKKAEPVKAGGTPTLPSQSGKASVDALLLGAMAFLLFGMLVYSFPAPRRAEAETCGGKPLGQWVQVVKVVDERPFFVRLLASLRPDASFARINGTNGTDGIYGVGITKVELTGGADF